MLIAVVVAFAVAVYYGAKLSQAERRAEEAEARLKQIEQQVSDMQSKFKVGDAIPKDAIIAPANLFCPDGTNLTSVDSFGRDENGKLRNQGPVWQCMGEPKRVASKPSSRNP